jgi:hypothetical protein
MENCVHKSRGLWRSFKSSPNVAYLLKDVSMKTIRCCCRRVCLWVLAGFGVAGFAAAVLTPECILAQELQMSVTSAFGAFPAGQADNAYIFKTSARTATASGSPASSMIAGDSFVSFQPTPVVLTSAESSSALNLSDSSSEQPRSPSEEKLGQAPEDYSHQFLRQESVLLKKGQYQFDVGLNYTVFDHNFTNLGIGIGESNGQATVAAVDSRFTSRLLLMPLDLRYGICDRLQAFADVPFGWSNTERSCFGEDDFTNTGGIGDVTVGVSWLAHKTSGCSCDPDVIFTFGCTAPTADVSPLQGIVEPPNTLLGQGFFYGSWNVLFVHTIDPIIVFYGFGSRHGVTREYHGYEIRPGDQYIYRCGLGFAVNERVTLSTVATGCYITAPYLNGTRIEGLDMEPISVRFGATIAMAHCRRFWDPFVEIGLTPDAPNARVGMTFTF